MSEFWKKYKHPLWQKRRLDIMERAGFKCESCESEDKTLNVHHKLYRKGADPWDYADHELQCLCEDCHEEEHHIKRRLQEAMAQMHIGRLEELLGYAEGIIATDYVFTDEEGLPRKSWPLTSYSHAWGFLARQLAYVPPERVEEYIAKREISDLDVFGLQTEDLAGKLKGVSEP